MLPNDFPDWFSNFIEEQLDGVPEFIEQSSYGIDNLTIAYIRLWSIYETYIKIINKLYEKRCAIKEIEAKIEQAKTNSKELNEWTEKANKIFAAYSESVRFGKDIELDENLSKVSTQVKSIQISKFSTRKSDIALMRLPNAKDIEKASKELLIESTRISHLLYPSNSESKFYRTRNTIAHEGKSDIQLRNFIPKRINPLQEVVEIINECVNGT